MQLGRRINRAWFNHIIYATDDQIWMSHEWRMRRDSGWHKLIRLANLREFIFWVHPHNISCRTKLRKILCQIKLRNALRGAQRRVLLRWTRRLNVFGSRRPLNSFRSPLRRGVPLQLVAFILALSCSPQQVNGQESPSLPTFEELEAEGAIIGEIRINNQNIFDLDDPEENNSLYGLANKLHIRTRPSVIRRALLFKSGEPVSAQVMEESERLLFSSGFLYEAIIRPIAYHDGVVDVEVITKDTWTLDPGIGFSRSGGDTRSTFGLTELNLFGTGVAIGYKQRDTDGVTSETFEYSHPLLLGTRGAFNYAYETFEDGDRQAFSLARPFYRLDARWSAGVSGFTSDSLASTYSNDNVVTGQYRVQRDFASVFGGWSKGLIGGWTRRYSIGVDYDKLLNSPVPGSTPPTTLPEDEIRVSPFIRYDIIEDNYAKLTNRDQIDRAEYFELGFRANIKLGYAATALGSTRPAWSYTAAISNGVTLSDDRMIVAAAGVSGVYVGGDDENRLFSGGLKYYIPQSDRALTFFGLGAGAARDRLVSTQLTLGGNNGLPGYPTDYQRGDRRALLNFEQRIYTDWYPFRLFRVGGAVFFDAGSAWGDEASGSSKPDWLADVGFGLRIFSMRSAFGSVWHLDFAFPINPPDDIPSYQVLLLRKTSF
jgi:outer membrane protein assembly factor BamA